MSATMFYTCGFLCFLCVALHTVCRVAHCPASWHMHHIARLPALSEYLRR